VRALIGADTGADTVQGSHQHSQKEQ
jgi:hypothetical protein